MKSLVVLLLSFFSLSSLANTPCYLDSSTVSGYVGGYGTPSTYVLQDAKYLVVKSSSKISVTFHEDEYSGEATHDYKCKPQKGYTLCTNGSKNDDDFDAFGIAKFGKHYTVYVLTSWTFRSTVLY